MHSARTPGTFGLCGWAHMTVVPLRGGGIKAWPKIPRAWWPKIAEEYAAGVSGPKLAEMSSSNTRASACFNPA